MFDMFMYKQNIFNLTGKKINSAFYLAGQVRFVFFHLKWLIISLEYLLSYNSSIAFFQTSSPDVPAIMFSSLRILSINLLIYYDHI